jgi:hypothetical protein
MLSPGEHTIGNISLFAGGLPPIELEPHVCEALGLPPPPVGDLTHHAQSAPGGIEWASVFHLRAAGPLARIAYLNSYGVALDLDPENDLSSPLCVDDRIREQLVGQQDEIMESIVREGDVEARHPRTSPPCRLGRSRKLNLIGLRHDAATVFVGSRYWSHSRSTKQRSNCHGSPILYVQFEQFLRNCSPGLPVTCVGTRSSDRCDGVHCSPVTRIQGSSRKFPRATTATPGGTSASGSAV